MPDDRNLAGGVKAGHPNRKWGWAGASIFALVAAAIYWLPNSCLLGKCRSIAPMYVETSNVEQPGNRYQDASGLYQMVKVMWGGIETDAFGGGCLIFKQPNSPVCTVKTDCSRDWLKASYYGQTAYCADKACWVKIKEAHCRKSSHFTPPERLVVGIPMSTPVISLQEVRADIINPPPTVDARVVARLNAKAPSPRFIEKFGQPKNLKLP